MRESKREGGRVRGKIRARKWYIREKKRKNEGYF